MASEAQGSSGGEGREGGEQSQQSDVGDQDLLLPTANITRIMKKALPPGAKISKEAKEVFQKCVSEFVHFITGTASDKCKKEARRTITGDDLLSAMNTIGFDDYIEPLRLYLQKYREMEGLVRQTAQASLSPSKRDARSLEGGGQPGTSIQGDNKMPRQDSHIQGMSYLPSQSNVMQNAQESINLGKIDASALEGGGQPGTSMQGDNEMPHQDSYIQGMSYLPSQFDYSDLES